MDELLRDFLTESSEHIEGAESQILQFEREPTNASLIAGIFRLVHTIKGTAGFVGLDRLQAVAHAAETVIGDLRDGAIASQTTISLILAGIDRIKWILGEVERTGEEPAGSDDDIINALAESAKTHGDASVEGHATTQASPVQASPASPVAIAVPKQAEGAAAHKDEAAAKPKETIRVTVDTIESIMQLVSELVLTRNQLVELTRRQENEIVKVPLQRLSSLTTDLQDAVMRARMQPVGRLYSNLPRLVRELASELGKKLTLVTEGADTEIDRQLIDVIRDPLTHLIRNCADHGIETAEQRVAAGKSEHGEIRVSASHQAGQITIAISDDGRGLNAEKIAAKVIASGRATAEEVRNFSFDELSKFIFEPGLSTAEVVSNVSGRGVGMDVVRSNIESIGGTVSITSKPGQGTVFLLKIPLTLAIAPALILEAGRQRFALPQHAVVEVVGLGDQSLHQLEKVQNALILKLREEVLPAIELSSILGLESAQSTERLAVIMKVGTTPFAMIVDDVLDVQEIVVKPLSASLAHLKVFSGRTILGDGSVVLILDSGGIATRIGIESTGEKKRESSKSSGDHRRTTRLIMFRAGPGSLKALPLSVVARIETVASDQMSMVDGRLVMMRQSRLMPVVSISNSLDYQDDAPHALLVIGQGDQAVGLLVDEVKDIVEEELAVQIEGEGNECIGAAQIRGEPVEVLDIMHYLQQAQIGSRMPRHRGTVLLASDGEIFADVMSPMLVAAGYTVQSAKNLLDAPRLIGVNTVPDAVLIDLDMKADTRNAWIDYLANNELADERMFGLFSQNNSHMSAKDQAAIPQRISKADRRTMLEMLAQVVDARNDENEKSTSSQSRGLAA
ncbi:MAG: chemotaxis protein CheW [Hyphomicrobium sp.]